jgi:hypothetical protein
MSGFHKPSKDNAEAFEQAVDAVATVEAAKARARPAQRFAA